VRVKDSKTTNH